MTTAEMRKGLTLALKYIERGDSAEAVELLREFAERLSEEGWDGLALVLRLAAAELGEGSLARAREHWFEAWGYIEGVEFAQKRQRA